MKHDLELTELLLLLRNETGTLNYLDREKKYGKMFDALGRIHDYSRRAQWRLNDLSEKAKNEQGEK